MTWIIFFTSFCSVQEFMSDNKTLGLLYTPTVDNIVFNYSLQRKTVQRSIDDEITIQILFTSQKQLDISQSEEVTFMEEDQFNTTTPCDLFEDARPHVTFVTENGCYIRVLSTVSTGLAYKIIKEQTIQIATIFITIVSPDGSKTTINDSVIADQEYNKHGIHVKFSTTHIQQFKSQSVLVTPKSIADSFYYRYFNSQTGCNSFPTNIGYWKNKVMKDRFSPLNKYLFIPNPINNCVLPNNSKQTSILESYKVELPFEQYANIKVDGNKITMDSQLPRLPTIMVSFDSTLIHYSKPTQLIEMSYRYYKDMKTERFVLKFTCTNGNTTFVSSTVKITCGDKQFQIPSQFYNPEDVKYFEFNTSSAAACQTNGVLIDGNFEEQDWKSNLIYESSICDDRFHIPLNNTHCFSGCSSDTILEGLQCVQDCKNIYGLARPYFDPKTQSCVNYQNAADSNITIIQPPFKDQFSNFEIICEHGFKNENSSALTLPCKCDNGFNQMAKNETHLIFCLANNFYKNPEIPSITGKDALAQFGKDFSDTFDEILNSFGIFSDNKIIKVVMIAGCVVLAVLIVTVFLKIVRILPKRVIKQKSVSLSELAAHTSSGQHDQ